MQTRFKYFLAVILVGGVIAIFLLLVNDPLINTKLFQNSDNQKNYDTQAVKLKSNSDDPEGPFKVVKVRDGDTIELDNGMVIRYLYVDTPETKKPGTPVQCFGPEASDYNKKFLEGKMVRLTKDKGDQDQYSRYLRLVYIEGKDATKPEQSVNYMLVKLGFAKVKFYSPNYKFKSIFQDAESLSKDQKVGLWSACAEKAST